jgi:hypothetical protein
VQKYSRGTQDLVPIGYREGDSELQLSEWGACEMKTAKKAEVAASQCTKKQIP